jgi:hypothetical protein
MTTTASFASSALIQSVLFLSSDPQGKEERKDTL